MKGYLVANITVTDPERYKLYKDAAPAVIGAFGGRYLVRGPNIETVEGGLPLGERFVILEFESLEQARTFYFSSQYQDIAAHRKAGSISDFHLMEGCIDPAEAFHILESSTVSNP